MRLRTVYSPFTNHVIDSLGNAVCMVVESEMAEKHRTRQNHSARVGLILAFDIKTNVTAARLENSNISSHVASGNNAGSTNEGSANVGKNTTVQVGHDHHIKLLRARDSLHRSVVDNHIVNLQGGVVFGSLVESAAEQAVRKLHDIRFVDASDLLPVVRKRKAESKLSDTLGLGASDDLK